MRSIRRLGIALVRPAGGVSVTAKVAAVGSARPVDFQVTRVTDRRGKPFAIGVWYPTEARTWPTAMPGPVLADVAHHTASAGCVVAAPVASVRSDRRRAGSRC